MSAVVMKRAPNNGAKINLRATQPPKANLDHIGTEITLRWK